jgi:hypothetical protein
MLNGLSIKLKDEEKTDDYYYRDIYTNPLDISISKHTYAATGGASYNSSEYDSKYYETNYQGGGQDDANESLGGVEEEGIFNLITKKLFNYEGGKKKKITTIMKMMNIIAIIEINIRKY